jgi:hypothetical protein
MSDTTFAPALLQVVHPLDDMPEQKLYNPGLGRMSMTTPVRAALLLLQLYLGGMVLLLAWRAIAIL